MSKSEIKRQSIRRSGLSSCCCSLTTCFQLYYGNTQEDCTYSYCMFQPDWKRLACSMKSHYNPDLYLPLANIWLMPITGQNSYIVVRRGCHTWPSLFSVRVPYKHQWLSPSVLLAAGFSIKLVSRLAGCSVLSSLSHSDDGRYRASWIPVHVSFWSVSVSLRHFPSLLCHYLVSPAFKWHLTGRTIIIFKLWKAAPWQ